MQFQRIRVQNWRCFTDESVRFEDGVTVLYGNNGSGKSSLLEAAFFALYGSDALDTGTTMDDVVTTDQNTAEVTLSFAHRGESYEVTREIRVRGDTYQEADLTTPPGQPDLDQIGAIDDLIEEELRLNAEDFLNSAYVQQGDVSRLIDASPTQRQRIIDNLLQMSKLEQYRSRMDSIGTGVGRVAGTKEDQVQELTTQIEEYDEPRIQSRKQQLHGFESELEDRRDDITVEVEELETKQAAAQEIVDTQEDAEETVEETRENAAEHMADLASAVAEYQSLQDEFTEAEANVAQHQDELTALFAVGTGDLTTGFGAVEDIVTEVTEKADAVLKDGVADASVDGRLPQTGTDPRKVATALVSESNDEPAVEIAATVDDILTGLSTDTAPLTPAVTGESGDGDTDTIGTTDAVDETAVDPLTNPTVDIDVSLARVPTSGLDVEPEALELSVAEEAQDQARDTVNDIRERLQALETAAEEASTKADHLEQDTQQHIREADAALDDATTVLTDIENIRRGRSELDDQRAQLDAEIDTSPFTIATEDRKPDAALETLIERIEHRITRLKAEQEHYRDEATRLGERIEQADRLLDEGNCPECGRPVDGAPNVEHREQWEDERNAAEQLVEALSEGITALEQRKDQAEDLLTTAQDLYGDDLTVTVAGTETTTSAIQVDPSTDLTPLHEDAAEHHLDARGARHEAHETRFQAVVQHLTATILTRAAERTLAHLTRALAQKEVLSQIEAAVDKRTNAERDLELAETHLDTQTTTVTDTHTDLQEEINAYSDATESFNPEKLKEAEDTVAEITDQLDTLNEELEDLRATERAVSEHLGDLGQQLTKLNELRDTRDTRQREATAVKALNNQVDELEAMFVNLRADLREQNVHRLEGLLQEMFDTLYRNDAYADIKLDGDYDATLIEKGGGKLPPTKLSGGESAVFNLALRGAIYRLLTEGFEDDVPMPPLILDEPTAHLDDGHVDRLNDVVEAMRTAGVKQTIVVSHDEGLIDSADHRIHVRQQQGTNRSVTEPENTLPVDL
ncbi:AAA family ATPase [Halomicroarcula sp. S1AR25-4]|uniref:AAA family ATPase n=1 Tax=Haloarcula sp. S1AR25-4 TaxID=2950538 RepID=UPI0028748B44|nr:AAA family ATPase [Halomicroarcula sp. S1AR25-4]MDS0276568.1 AAA family ATPase [Halomicroarcula sp. S1AR25-4]